MSSPSAQSLKWQQFDRPPRLERRYLFDGYTELRAFLDQAADLFESMELYPDMSFGRDYVNITIHGYEDGLDPRCHQLAEALEALWHPPSGTD